eukprot:5126538-Alexandrium_andersonii.AAC.1
MRQYGPRVPVLDDKDGQGRFTSVLREEAIVHCDLRDGMLTRESASVRGIGHTPAHAVRAPRLERD